jgi:hypothetical protein
MADTTKMSRHIIDLKLARKGLTNTVEGAIGLAVALVVSFPAKLLLFGVLLLYLLGLGLILIVVRYLFMLLLPTLIQFAVPLTALIDYFEIIIVAFVDAAIGVVNSIIEIIDVLSGKSTNNMVHYVGFKLFTVDQVRSELKFILENCMYDTDAFKVLGNVALSVTQKPVCSAMRYVYPSRWLYAASVSIAGWLYEGSAVPDVSPSHDDNANCGFHVASGYIPPVCAALGSGYVLVEMVVPLYLLIILHSAIGVTLWVFLWGALQLGYVAVKAAVALLEVLFAHYLG